MYPDEALRMFRVFFAAGFIAEAIGIALYVDARIAGSSGAGWFVLTCIGFTFLVAGLFGRKLLKRVMCR